nr:MAG TPA: hypothetical protein [Caudoviricetes sp.]
MGYKKIRLKRLLLISYTLFCSKTREVDAPVFPG